MRHPSRPRAKLAQFLFSLSLVTGLPLSSAAADSLLIENVTLDL
ncbi:MAG: hypothetical protein RIC29_14515 [Rhodospirillaceae bacterium]